MCDDKIEKSNIINNHQNIMSYKDKSTYEYAAVNYIAPQQIKNIDSGFCIVGIFETEKETNDYKNKIRNI